jgi:cell envelope opacity-associated protein A
VSAPAVSAQKQPTPSTPPTPPAPPKERKPIPKRKPASKEPETSIKDSTKPAAQQASAVTISGKEPVQAEQNNSDFDWDKFLEENRHE